MILYYNAEVILRLNALNPLIKCLNLILIYILHACSFLTLVHINLNIVCRRAGRKTTCILKKVYLTLIRTLFLLKEFFPCQLFVMRKQESGPGQSNTFFSKKEAFKQIFWQ